MVIPIIIAATMAFSSKINFLRQCNFHYPVCLPFCGMSNTFFQIFPKRDIYSEYESLLFHPLKNFYIHIVIFYCFINVSLQLSTVIHEQFFVSSRKVDDWYFFYVWLILFEDGKCCKKVLFFTGRMDKPTNMDNINEWNICKKYTWSKKLLWYFWHLNQLITFFFPHAISN